MFIGRLDTAEEAIGVENLVHLSLEDKNDLVFYKLLINKHPQASEIERIIAVEDGIVVAHALLIPKTLLWRGVKVQADEVGFAVTHPSYRNRGLMKAILKKATSYAKERKKPISFIYGIPYFYRQFGYEYAIFDDTFGPYITVPSSSSKGKKGFSTRLTTPSDIQKLSSFFEKENKSTALRAHRNRAEWIFQEALIASMDGMESWVFTDGSRTKGYCRVQRDSKGLVVREFAAEGMSKKDNIIRYFASLRDIAGGEDLRLGIPAFHSLSKSIIGMGGEKIGKDYGAYVRIDSLYLLLMELMEPMSESLRKSEHKGYEGTLLLDMYEQSVALFFNNGNIEIHKDTEEEPDMHLRLPPGALVQVATGYKSVEEIKEICDVIGGEKALSLLSALFPLQESYMWYFDR